MTEEFKASKPIYAQIADRIIYQFVRGELSPGDKLPSVRDMAIQSGVNPNTIQRTYGELERMGVVETKRGQGTFMTTNEDTKVILQRRIQKEIIETFVQSMREIGVKDAGLVDELAAFLKSEGGKLDD